MGGLTTNLFKPFLRLSLVIQLTFAFSLQHHSLHKRSLTDSPDFLQVIEDEMKKIPLENFRDDPELLQKVDEDKGITSYALPSDTATVIYQRLSVDEGKEIIVLTSKEDHLLFKKFKRRYVVLRRKDDNDKYYYVVYAYLRDATSEETDAVTIGGSQYTIEWDTWDYRGPGKDRFQTFGFSNCGLSTIVPCGYNSETGKEAGNTVDPLSVRQKWKPSSKFLNSPPDHKLKRFVTESGYDIHDNFDLYGDLEVTKEGSGRTVVYSKGGDSNTLDSSEVKKRWESGSIPAWAGGPSGTFYSKKTYQHTQHKAYSSSVTTIEEGGITRGSGQQSGSESSNEQSELIEGGSLGKGNSKDSGSLKVSGSGRSKSSKFSSGNGDTSDSSSQMSGTSSNSDASGTEKGKQGGRGVKKTTRTKNVQTTISVSNTEIIETTSDEEGDSAIDKKTNPEENSPQAFNGSAMSGRGLKGKPGSKGSGEFPADFTPDDSSIAAVPGFVHASPIPSTSPIEFQPQTPSKTPKTPMHGKMIPKQPEGAPAVTGTLKYNEKWESSSTTTYEYEYEGTKYMMEWKWQFIPDKPNGGFPADFTPDDSAISAIPGFVHTSPIPSTGATDFQPQTPSKTPKTPIHGRMIPKKPEGAPAVTGTLKYNEKWESSSKTTYEYEYEGTKYMMEWKWQFIPDKPNGGTPADFTPDDSAIAVIPGFIHTSPVSTVRPTDFQPQKPSNTPKTPMHGKMVPKQPEGALAVTGTLKYNEKWESSSKTTYEYEYEGTKYMMEWKWQFIPDKPNGGIPADFKPDDSAVALIPGFVYTSPVSTVSPTDFQPQKPSSTPKTSIHGKMMPKKPEGAPAVTGTLKYKEKWEKSSKTTEEYEYEGTKYMMEWHWEFIPDKPHGGFPADFKPDDSAVAIIPGFVYTVPIPTTGPTDFQPGTPANTPKTPIHGKMIPKKAGAKAVTGTLKYNEKWESSSKTTYEYEYEGTKYMMEWKWQFIPDKPHGGFPADFKPDDSAIAVIPGFVYTVPIPMTGPTDFQPGKPANTPKTPIHGKMIPKKPEGAQAVTGTLKYNEKWESSGKTTYEYEYEGTTYTMEWKWQFFPDSPDTTTTPATPRKQGGRSLKGKPRPVATEDETTDSPVTTTKKPKKGLGGFPVDFKPDEPTATIIPGFLYTVPIPLTTPTDFQPGKPAKTPKTPIHGTMIPKNPAGAKQVKGTLKYNEEWESSNKSTYEYEYEGTTYTMEWKWQFFPDLPDTTTTPATPRKQGGRRLSGNPKPGEPEEPEKPEGDETPKKPKGDEKQPEKDFPKPTAVNANVSANGWTIANSKSVTGHAIANAIDKTGKGAIANAVNGSDAYSNALTSKGGDALARSDTYGAGGASANALAMTKGAAIGTALSRGTGNSSANAFSKDSGAEANSVAAQGGASRANSVSGAAGDSLASSVALKGGGSLSNAVAVGTGVAKSSSLADSGGDSRAVADARKGGGAVANSQTRNGGESQAIATSVGKGTSLSNSVTSGGGQSEADSVAEGGDSVANAVQDDGKDEAPFDFKAFEANLNNVSDDKFLLLTQQGREFDSPGKGAQRSITFPTLEDQPTNPTLYLPGWKTQYQKIVPNATFEHDDEVFFGLASCPYKEVSANEIDSAGHYDDFISFYTTYLRSWCMLNEFEKIKTIVNDGVLVAKDKTFTIPPTSKFATQWKLTSHQLDELTMAFELDVFSHLFIEQRDQQSPGVSRSPSKSAISRSTRFLVDFIIRGIDQSRKLRPHYVRLTRQLIFIAKVVYAKLLQDFDVLDPCQDCKADKEMNQNDRIEIMAALEFMMKGLSPVDNGAQAEPTFVKFFLSNQRAIEIRVNTFAS